jgi:hypothetical protein
MTEHNDEKYLEPMLECDQEILNPADALTHQQLSDCTPVVICTASC